MTWEQAVEYLQNTMNVYVDEEEGFFVCPECDEPIYKCDWEDHPDFIICPICEFNYETLEYTDDAEEEEDEFDDEEEEE